MLWAKKMGILPFDKDKQAAAKTTLLNMQPMEVRMQKLMDADEAVILPAKDLVKRLEPILEQRLAEAIAKGEDPGLPTLTLTPRRLSASRSHSSTPSSRATPSQTSGSGRGRMTSST